MEPLTPEEVRVVGCLIEKQMTTPDYYPMTQNAVMAACNQLSNRNPVVSYDDNTVRLTLNSLRGKQVARIIHTPGSRAPKHRHVFDEALELERGELALLGVLMLRGPQTAGELRTRTERMHEFATLSEVEETLERLADRADPLVVRLERQPGQKEPRYVHLLGGEGAAEAASEAYGAAASTEAAPAAERPEPAAVSGGGAGTANRIAALESRLAAVEEAVAEMRRALGLAGDEPGGGPSDQPGPEPPPVHEA
ncbi:MAG TPA: YceH family protein [Acidimicrobiia bacterium]|nr:YceH family protein [Acidimicrobiia bacterium]